MKTPYRTQDGAHLYDRDNQVVAVAPNHSQCVLDPSERMHNVNKTAYQFKDGKFTPYVTPAPGDDEVVADGEVVRVPLFAMDSKADYLQDGEAYHTLADGSVVKIKAKQDQATRGQPTFDAAHQRPREGVRSVADRARTDSAHHLMSQRNADAWKKGGVVPAREKLPLADNAEAVAHARQFGFGAGPHWRAGIASGGGAFAAKTDPQSFQREQDAFDKQKERLQNAWRNPKR